jgi:lipopolysaccharide transport system permease protein
MRCRAPLLRTLVDELKRKHAGSVFGVTWFLIMPLLFLAFYATVYLVIFKVRPASMSPFDYLLFIYIGLMAYLGFSESMTAGAGALVVNRAIMLNTVFPAELLSLRTVLSVQMTFVIGMALAIVWAILVGRTTFWVVTIPIIMALQVTFLVGLAWFLAPLYIVFRDLGQLLNFVSLAILVISPIAYRASELTGFQRVLLYINPLYYYLACYQSVIFDGTRPPLTFLLAGTVMAALTFVLGFWFFVKVKPVVAEHV